MRNPLAQGNGLRQICSNSFAIEQPAYSPVRCFARLDVMLSVKPDNAVKRGTFQCGRLSRSPAQCSKRSVEGGARLPEFHVKEFVFLCSTAIRIDTHGRASARTGASSKHRL
jgi:hypothetical protein